VENPFLLNRSRKKRLGYIITGYFEIQEIYCFFAIVIKKVD